MSDLSGDLVQDVMSYEAGELDASAEIDLLARLIRSGMAWTLQGSYGRAADLVIRAGYVSRDGAVLKYP